MCHFLVVGAFESTKAPGPATTSVKKAKKQPQKWTTPSTGKVIEKDFGRWEKHTTGACT